MYDRIIKSLTEECSNYTIRWKVIEQLVSELKPVINKKTDEDETLLSTLYKGYFVERGEDLLRLTKLFLENGYDVKANRGFNGGVCLHDLCWSSYDGYILEIAKLLLDCGADPHYYDEDGDLLECITFKLGNWLTGEYECANLFQAYYRLIEEAQMGTDYHAIYSLDQCVGKRLCKIETAQIYEDNTMILQFEDFPVVVSKYIDFVVDPIWAQQAKNVVNLTGEYSSVLGAKLSGFRFFNYRIASLQFENGKELLFYQDLRGDKIQETKTAVLENRNYLAEALNGKIQRMYFDGRGLSHIRSNYCTDVIYLQKEERCYLLVRDEKTYNQFKLVCKAIGMSQLSESKLHLDCEDLQVCEVYANKNGIVWCICFHMGKKYLYLLADNHEGITLILRSRPFARPEEIRYSADSETIKFSQL